MIHCAFLNEIILNEKEKKNFGTVNCPQNVCFGADMTRTRNHFSSDRVYIFKDVNGNKFIA